MGWLILLGFAIVTAGALLLVARPGRGAVELIAAAMLVAVAGYVWQGKPDLPGKPTPPRANHPASDELFARERKVWLDQVGADGQALDAADGLIARGDPAYAIGIMRAAIARAPEDMTLWIGLGNALVTYADGAVTPPARYAFERAGGLAPKHPAPAYFLGLAYANSGDLDTAEKVWRDLLAKAPDHAPWKPLVVEKLTLLQRARLGG